jgi:hypothetical protein
MHNISVDLVFFTKELTWGTENLLSTYWEKTSYLNTRHNYYLDTIYIIGAKCRHNSN